LLFAAKLGTIFSMKLVFGGSQAILVSMLLSLSWLVPTWGSSASGSMPPEAERVARDFLFAFSLNDRPAIERMIPKKLSNLYGPCPFDRMPSLTNPRVDERVGAVDFSGKMADGALPRKGTIVLRRVDEGDGKRWRVRQIYWYDELPPEAEIPDRSKTRADQAQEPKLWEAAKEFIHYWLAEDFEEMDARTFHWWTIDRRPPKWVRMTSVDLKARPSRLNEIRVDFSAKLTVLKVIPKRVGGNIWLVEEDGQWRVRPLQFAFFF
jgi:hypothetical protein